MAEKLNLSPDAQEPAEGRIESEGEKISRHDVEMLVSWFRSILEDEMSECSRLNNHRGEVTKTSALLSVQGHEFLGKLQNLLRLFDRGANDLLKKSDSESGGK